MRNPFRHVPEAPTHPEAAHAETIPHDFDVADLYAERAPDDASSTDRADALEAKLRQAYF